MTTPIELSKQSELALASYADLYFQIPSNTFVDRLEAAGMTNSQAVRFASTYTVLTQHNGTGNGLSATVFADADGQKYLAIRGTDDLYDLITDTVNIAVLGSTTLQAQYTALKTKVTEWLGNGTLSSSFTVTGHSLGGFLATGIAADFPSKVIAVEYQLNFDAANDSNWRDAA